ncbi:hypothetical protein OE88DRAFT_522079 [Heliocybe sulcata]|uniref:MFS general substrate transporter n=1 Tax=Heliocybe sulcata TaxID=5364 RepID=A0A5C3MW30_9AGAM|nr:hypothetical protein OE88DRAFT_522079 [Heliocybe sulcata]
MRWSAVGPVSALLLGFATISVGFTKQFWALLLNQCVIGFFSAATALSKDAILHTWRKPKHGSLRSPVYNIPFTVVYGLMTATVILLPLIGQSRQPWRFIFFFHGTVITLASAYAWSRSPGLPDTAGWLSESERGIVAKWKSEYQKNMERRRQSRHSDPPPPSGEEDHRDPPIRRYLKLLYIGYWLSASHLARSIAWLWPMIFVRVCSIDKPGPLALLESVAPWFLPGCLVLLYHRLWPALLRKPLVSFLKSEFVVYYVCMLVAFSGSLFGGWLNPGWPSLRVLSLFSITFLFVGDIPFDATAAFGIGSLTDSLSARKLILAIMFLGSCRAAGEVFASYNFIGEDGTFREKIIFSWPAYVAMGSVVFSLGFLELVRALKRAKQRRDIEGQEQEQEMEMLPEASNVLI